MTSVTESFTPRGQTPRVAGPWREGSVGPREWLDERGLAGGTVGRGSVGVGTEGETGPVCPV